jgi:serine-type D-Ala-D-Ala carboxypeptidase/endopeptidase
MILKRLARVSILITLAFCGRAMAASPPQIPPDAEIRQILVQRIDTYHRSVGIVVGVIDPQGRRIIAYGYLAQGDSRPLNGDTVFEIGSVTKVFTSLLLSEMVQRGEVKLSDPVEKYLPSTVKVPQRDGRQITLVDLATHTSGLPRMPSNFTPQDPHNPYKGYSVEQLYQFLSNYKLTRDPGTQYEYSNLGGGLLGLALARRAGMDYGKLVEAWICKPLGMHSTGIALTPQMKARLATGHNAALKPVENWDLPPAFAGAGALRSTANDMLTFLGANLGITKTPLAPAMGAMLSVRRPTGMLGVKVALGWHIFTINGKDIVWHNGGTGGYRSFIGFDPKVRVGVVVLSNSETPEGVDDIGHQLLDARVALYEPPSERKEVHVDPTIFSGYVGYYQLSPRAVVSITQQEGHLYTQITGQPKFELFPSGPKDYFLKVVNAQVTFVTDGSGRATELIIHQNGMHTPAKRINGPVPAMAPKERKAIHVAADILEKYVGNYQLAPNFDIRITREGDHLFEQATNQQKFEIFPESEKEFFLKVVNAQITFVTDSSGLATELVLHQGGMNHHGKRLAELPAEQK